MKRPFGLIDRRHPISRAAWRPSNVWLALPGQSGGNLLRDVVGGNHGTLTNGPTWGGEPDGRRAVNFDGTDDYVQFTGTGNMTAYTVAVRLKRTRSADYEVAVGDSVSGNSNAFGWGPSGATYLFVQTHGVQTFPSVSGTRALGEWQTMVLTTGQDKPIVATVNGVSTNVGTGSQFGTTAWDRIGARSGFNYGGPIQSVWLWNGVILSDSQAQAFCQEADAGFPTFLRRVSPVSWLVGTGGGGSAYGDASFFPAFGW